VAKVGRKAGVPNKSTQELRDLIDKISHQRTIVAETEGATKTVSGLEQVVERLFELADGVQVEKTMDGKETVFSVLPSEAAAKTVLELRFGKARQSIETRVRGWCSCTRVRGRCDRSSRYAINEERPGRSGPFGVSSLLQYLSLL
jgi:hypothetical protein